ncbi:hypothetical protein [Streptomyces caniscabiei]|uniref:Uncharacterized protein n=1 Tax=Streptomyces caniscabiei TaxID=2746961 RepID=A0ABU4MYN5_9ACTN|nr:hypothetical protein [Streptomyces caniscabiei]MBE4761796.1 hypothetical protein [Streptomyces caniscabiei]MBE4790301.1 hypothetical protein [Streptomyces caniscabiei]MBE4799470.1 hypothetical protein [Streptomyces caniscabiei]MDX2947915.1 hypothetical protein [Streptomyces caniscabiei]MDX3015158.1 hypothetical protein [Streptomyces caniscabiei]
MAVTSLSPHLPASDLVTLTEASELFRETGHEATVRTLKRWCVKHGIQVERVQRADCASWSDLLVIHAREVDARERGRS